MKRTNSNRFIKPILISAFCLLPSAFASLPLQPPLATRPVLREALQLLDPHVLRARQLRHLLDPSAESRAARALGRKICELDAHAVRALIEHAQLAAVVHRAPHQSHFPDDRRRRHHHCEESIHAFHRVVRTLASGALRERVERLALRGRRRFREAVQHMQRNGFRGENRRAEARVLGAEGAEHRVALWPPSRKRSADITARRCAWPTWPSSSGPSSSATIPSSRTGQTATASFSPPATRRCCSTRSSISPAIPT